MLGMLELNFLIKVKQGILQGGYYKRLPFQANLVDAGALFFCNVKQGILQGGYKRLPFQANLVDAGAFCNNWSGCILCVAVVLRDAD
ncbi:uncharacterized protein LOC135207801 isoform X5 [Macrobrachium nipponense]|uniref:uncharacterized protein LOC135207801 isoform X5 n=1 Tax=Macrobrachium nipponense TaxID=159736 RepID=UPI0030C80201